MATDRPPGGQGAPPPPPDVTVGAVGAAARPRMTLTLALPDLRPVSPGPVVNLKRTKSNGESNLRTRLMASTLSHFKLMTTDQIREQCRERTKKNTRRRMPP